MNEKGKKTYTDLYFFFCFAGSIHERLHETEAFFSNLWQIFITEKYFWYFVALFFLFAVTFRAFVVFHCLYLRYSCQNGILHYLIPTPNGPISKPFVPRQSRLGLLRIFHDEQCHVGVDKTLDSIQKHFWFPRMRYFVAKYIKHCLICAVKKTRSGPLQGFITNVDKPSEPMNTIHADCLGPLESTSEGFKQILVLIDAFTKYCVLLPLKSVKAEETRQAFQLFISLFGTPKQINMDAGKISKI